MLQTLKNWLQDVNHLLYPHNCEGCANDMLHSNNHLCIRCQYELPYTGFEQVMDNPVEKAFYGRIKITHAAATCYFTKNGLIQHLLHQIKYKGNTNVGTYVGRLMGYRLQNTDRFNDVDVLLPLPLNARKLRKRGYNQAKIICNGIAEVWHKPIIDNAVVRTVYTQSQTRQSRMSRWENMDGVFEVSNPAALEGKHIVLVDDVMTTGATLEACGSVLLGIPGVRLSILTFAWTAR